jgi:hypothetical protein
VEPQETQPELETQELSIEHLKMRVPAVQEAIKRTRFALFLCVLASLATFTCLWNTYLSTNRQFAFDLSAPTNIVRSNIDSPDTSSMAQRARRDILVGQEVRAWVDSQSIAINLLGIHIGVSDFAVVNSIGMFIFVYYLLLSARRENREVGQLLRDLAVNLKPVTVLDGSVTRTSEAKTVSGHNAYAAYCALNAYMVFNLNRTDDTPIDSLEEKVVDPKKIALIRRVFDLMILSPFAVILFTVLSDIGSIFSSSHSFFGSPFRAKNILEAMQGDPTAMRYLITMDGFALIIGSVVLRLALRIKDYSGATRSVLDEFSKALKRRGYICGTDDES